MRMVLTQIHLPRALHCEKIILIASTGSRLWRVRWGCARAL